MMEGGILAFPGLEALVSDRAQETPGIASVVIFGEVDAATD